MGSPASKCDPAISQENYNSILCPVKELKISIITAVFNRADTVRRAIESVQYQQDVDLQHIVVDGLSTDGSLSVIEAFLDDHAILISEKDDGIYDAINKGIERSTGDVIGLMHSDDLYANRNVLKRVLDLFASKNVDAVYGDVAFFQPQQPDKLVRRYSSRKFRPETIAWGWMPAHTALFFRRAVFEQYGLYRTDYRIAADFEFVARVFGTGNLKAEYLPEVLIHMSTGGVSTGGWRSTIVLNYEVIRACRENNIRTNWLKILSKYPSKLLEFFR